MDREQLEGWKEIGRYLGKSVRTVQLWEKDLGLPVHRLQNRVYADPADLDAWLERQRVFTQTSGQTLPESLPDESGLPHPESIGVPVPPVQPDRTPRRWLAAAAFFVLAATLFAVARWEPAGLSPVSLKVEGAVLTAYDIENHRVFSHTLPAAPWGYVIGQNDPRDYPRSLFADLDGDGRNELLYVYWAQDMTANGTVLYCFRPDGSVAWKRKMGRPLETARGTALSNSFHTTTLAALAKARPDGGRLVVGSQHSHSYPYQVALLTADGTLVSEYFHPGWLLKIAIADLNGDGHEEILYGGVSASYGRDPDGNYGPALVVLDSRRVFGQGPVLPSEPLPLKGIPRGDEAAVLFFPSPVEPTENGIYYRVHRLRLSGDAIELEVRQTNEPRDAPHVLYRLDRKLSVIGVFPNNTLESIINASLRAGQSFGAAVQEKLGWVKVLKNEMGAKTTQ